MTQQLQITLNGETLKAAIAEGVTTKLNCIVEASNIEFIVARSKTNPITCKVVGLGAANAVVSLETIEACVDAYLGSAFGLYSVTNGVKLMSRINPRSIEAVCTVERANPMLALDDKGNESTVLRDLRIQLSSLTTATNKDMNGTIVSGMRDQVLISLKKLTGLDLALVSGLGVVAPSSKPEAVVFDANEKFGTVALQERFRTSQVNFISGLKQQREDIASGINPVADKKAALASYDKRIPVAEQLLADFDAYVAGTGTQTLTTDIALTDTPADPGIDLEMVLKAVLDAREDNAQRFKGMAVIVDELVKATAKPKTLSISLS